jgi:hypothetical protein
MEITVACKRKKTNKIENKNQLMSLIFISKRINLKKSTTSAQHQQQAK